jgi:hypothetical protein
MIRKKDMNKLIATFEDMLKDYEERLRCNPDSFFYKGLVKNTREFLEELYEEVQTQVPQSLTATNPLV